MCFCRGSPAASRRLKRCRLCGVVAAVSFPAALSGRAKNLGPTVLCLSNRPSYGLVGACCCLCRYIELWGGCGWLTLSAPPPLSSLLTAPAVRLPGFSSFPALQLAAIRCGGRGGAVHSLCHLQPSMLPRSSCALTAYLLRTCCALTAPAGGVGLVVFGGCPYAVTLAAAPSRRTRSTPHESSMSSATSIRFLTPC